MEFSLIFDALIAVLLVATIAYAAILNRKLGVLRDAKTEMVALIASLSESTERAGNGIESLKQEAGRSGEALQNKVERARALVDDLGFLIENGTRLAERLDGGIGAARAKPVAKAEIGAAGAHSAQDDPAGGVTGETRGGAGPGGQSGGQAAPEAAAADISAAENELLKALQGMR